MIKVKVLGTGSFAPEQILDNAYFEKTVDTNDAWIVERTGIRARRKAEEGVTTSDIAAEASRRALDAAGVKPEDVDCILLATSSPDRIVPATAVYVQEKIGAWNAAASDMIAACSGFAYALSAGRGLVVSGQSKRCLVIGAELLSHITDYKDRGTCIIFGDGAGAVLLGPSDGESDILFSKMGSDGRMADYIIVPSGGTAMPTTAETMEQNLQYIHMKGREVYKFAVPKFVEIIKEALTTCSLTNDDIDCFVPHQMNARMIEAVCKRLDFPMDKVMTNIDKYGNTSAASIPLALDEAVRADRIKRGDMVLMAAMGAGMTWGTVVLKW